jgi:hypothetical protein
MAPLGGHCTESEVGPGNDLTSPTPNAKSERTTKSAPSQATLGTSHRPRLTEPWYRQALFKLRPSRTKTRSSRSRIFVDESWRGGRFGSAIAGSGLVSPGGDHRETPSP